MHTRQDHMGADKQKATTGQPHRLINICERISEGF